MRMVITKSDTEMRFDMKVCGNRIKAARALKGMSQTDLAVDLGVTTITVSNWERGFSEPNAANLVGLATALGCTVDYIIGRSKQ